jgi:hypothetical protein
MTQDEQNVKGRARLGELWGRVEDWFVCHPKTIAWLSFFLFLNYVIDLIGGFWPP